MLLRQIKGCVWLYRCDWCSKEFEAAFSKSKSKTHGCSRSCGSKASRATVKANLFAKYGVENVSQLPEVREKVKRTTLERFGVECSWQNEEVKKKIKATMLERFGVESPWHSLEIRARMAANNAEKFGGEHPWASPAVREKAKQTMIERYSVDNPQKSPEIKERTKITCLERYGAENPWLSTAVRETTVRRHLQKYGVPNPSQRDEVKQKKIQTSLRNWGTEFPLQAPEVQQRFVKSFLMKGKGFVSKVELRCLASLRDLYEEVVHQVPINGWLIDFYVPKINTYVQFDGVYWHGVHMTEEQVDAAITKRERDVARKWHRDREQVVWFRSSGLRLVRITDEQFKSWEIDGTVRSSLKTICEEEP